MNTRNISNKIKRPIRFGIMCNGTIFPSWEEKCLNKMLALDNVKPALLIIDDDSLISSNVWRKLKKLNYLTKFWYIFSFFFVKFTSKAMRPVDMSSKLAQVPSIRCKVTKKGKFSQYFSDADIAEIRKYNLDFILRFGFNIIRGEILEVARFGVWSFHHDDPEKYRGLPPCFWEIYNDDSITGAIFQRLTERLDGGIVLKKGYFKTINTSYVRNIDKVYFDSADWPAQVCIDIQNGTADYLHNSPLKSSASIFRSPSNIQMIYFILKIVRNIFLKHYAFFFLEQWNIGIVKEPIYIFLKPKVRLKVQWLPTPAHNKFRADPFAIYCDKAVNILFEEWDYRNSKGQISMIKIMNRESISSTDIVIDSPFHMAYPYLLYYKDDIYCVPETFQAKEVNLYRAKEFPYEWEKVATLIKDFAGVDNTILHYDRLWWLFSTDKSDGSLYKLKVWHALNLFGPWIPHIANPVKVDIRSARSAGTPFVYNGHLYRPSQDCSVGYGKKIIINRVTKLTTAEFKEEEIAVVEPYKNSPYPDGLHTISSAGNMTIIDGMKKIFIGKSIDLLIYKIRRKGKFLN